MAVFWNWNKMGVITKKSDHTQDTRTWEYNVYQGTNCLGVVLYEYVNKDTGEGMYDFAGFWNDPEHLKNALGLTKSYPEILEWYSLIEKIRLNTYYKEVKKIAECFVKAHIPVELVYEEPEKNASAV